MFCKADRQPKYKVVCRTCVNFIYVSWSLLSSGILHILHYYQIFVIIPYKQSNVKSYSKCNLTQRKDAYLSSTMTD